MLCLHTRSSMSGEGGSGITIDAIYGVERIDDCPTGSWVDGDWYYYRVALTQASDAPPLNPLTLTAEQGVIVSSAICGVWLVAWAFRRFQEALQGPDDNS